MAETPDEPARIADTVNAWFAARLACGAIARDTDAYNQALAALPDLVARLTGTPAEQAAADSAAPAAKSAA